MMRCTNAELGGKLADFAGCCYLVYYADREITGGTLPEEIADPEQVLEIRAFDDDREIWFHRDSLDKDFYFRSVDDSSLEPTGYFDETQMLDIASDKPIVNNGKATFIAMGGGRYTLPVGEKVNAVVVRNYLRYNEQTGRAEACDFRILKFTSTCIEEV